MALSRKKVIVRSLAGAVHAGYLPGANFVEEAGGRATVALFDLSANLVPIPLETVRYIAYVRDFNREDAVDPERLTRKTFLGRPRAEGLWLRLTFLDGQVLEGLAPLDAALADGLLADRGFFVAPPDVRSNTQRLYVPRTALAGIQALAVVTTPSKPKPAPAPAGVGDLPFPELPRE